MTSDSPQKVSIDETVNMIAVRCWHFIYYLQLQLNQNKTSQLKAGHDLCFIVSWCIPYLHTTYSRTKALLPGSPHYSCQAFTNNIIYEKQLWASAGRAWPVLLNLIHYFWHFPINFMLKSRFLLGTRAMKPHTDSKEHPKNAQDPTVVILGAPPSKLWCWIPRRRAFSINDTYFS